MSAVSTSQSLPSSTQANICVHTDSPSAIGSTVAGGVHASRGGSVWGVLDCFWKIDLSDHLTRGRPDLPPQSCHLTHRAYLSQQKMCKHNIYRTYACIYSLTSTIKKSSICFLCQKYFLMPLTSSVFLLRISSCCLFWASNNFSWCWGGNMNIVSSKKVMKLVAQTVI